jgi:hypothetical protein
MLPCLILAQALTPEHGDGQPWFDEEAWSSPGSRS